MQTKTIRIKFSKNEINEYCKDNKSHLEDLDNL